MILPKTNLSIMDVRNCTGNPSLDLGTLCSKGQLISGVNISLLGITLLPADLQTGGKLQMEIVDWT